MKINPKKILLSIVILLSKQSYASWFGKEEPKKQPALSAKETLLHHSAQTNLGFDRGHGVFNLNYEYRFKEHFGIGGSFYFTPEDKEGFYPQIMTLGFFINIHQPINDFELYVRPGMGIGFFEGRTLSGKNEEYTSLAPSMGLGVLYKIIPNLSIGAEHLSTFIWTNKKFTDDDSSDFLLSAQLRF